MPDENIQQDPDASRGQQSRRDRYADEEPPRRRAGGDDGEDERRPLRRIRRDEDEDTGSGLNALIPYKNALALTAYYLGVFSLIPCIGVALGVAALVLGIMGLRYRTRNPTAGGAAHAWVGIVLGTLVLLAHLTVAVLIGIVS